METPALIDVEPIAKHLKLDLASVQRTAELLDEGNTVPFITRFRKDQIGGLDEQQIRAIQKELARAKLLAERKETILKSIESRGQLTDKLASQVRKARAMAVLEDIYLPYKPKKQSLASIARARGLAPFAQEVIHQTEAGAALDARAAEFVDEAKELPNVEAVLEGLQHLVAEHFGSHASLRSEVRGHMRRHGKIVSRQIENQPDEEQADTTSETESDAGKTEAPAKDGSANVVDASTPVAESKTVEVVAPSAAEPSSGEPSPETPATDTPSPEATSTETPEVTSEQPAETKVADESSSSPVIEPTAESTAAEPTAAEPVAELSTTPTAADTLAATEDGTASADTPVAAADTEAVADSKTVADSKAAASPEAGAEKADTAKPAAQAAGKAKPKASKKASTAKKDTVSRRDQRREMRRKRRERLVQSFKDYFDYSDPIGKLPHHRILAINRGERTKVLRVKIECPDWASFQSDIEAKFVSPEHPHAAFLTKCLQDAMGRLLIPSIEREIRRELNEKAEEHAVKVFARNLRKLLLQPPLHQHRVVAIDPGFRNGCKLAAVDEFGQILGHDFINLLGNEKQKNEGRAGLVKFVTKHGGSVIAIGNGAACRETEALVADILTNELKDQEVGYVIVNEAGTSVYSTSDLGREELPDYDAAVRSAVSIARRSLDPLSELVKTDPASIGVGLYQHDVKAKHLRESLDAVVESCVNYVGVDVNSASPSLLRYVSGLNSLTARKIFQHRQEHGPFKTREQIKAVNGIGESTYVQAVGFLKIADSENPLDATWIHPESYDTTGKVLEAIGYSVQDLQRTTADASKPSQPTVAADATPAAADAAKTEEASPSTAAATPEVAVAAEAATTPEVATAPEVAAATDASVAAETVEVQDAGQATPTADGATSEALVDPPPAPETVAAPTAETPETAVQEAAPAAEAPTAAPSEGPASEAKTEDLAAATSKPPQATATPTPEVRRSNIRVSCSPALAEKLKTIEAGQLAKELGVGKLLLGDILTGLERPGRDPREDLPSPIFRRGVLKLESLKPEMELSGTVLNVVDFGAFVDIGLVDSGLIHVSRLADKFVSDPHDVVSVGDILRVWVVEVDQKRRRVSLTAIEPGTERPKPAKEPRRSREPRGRKPEGGQPKGGGRGGDKGKRPRGKGRGKPAAAQYKPKAKPKPVVPITQKMEEGAEPMRTFGDLKQLFEKRKRGGSK